MTINSTSFIKADKFCDYVPVLSTATNLFCLFSKCVLNRPNFNNVHLNHYFEYLKEKSNLRCLILLVPVIGNIVVLIFDVQEKREAIRALKNGMSLQFVTNKWFKDDKDVVLAAVKKNPLNLEFASSRLKNDELLVLIAVRKDGMALKFASERLKNSEKIVFAAIYPNMKAWEFASDALKEKKRQLIQGIENGTVELSEDSDEFCSDTFDDLISNRSSNFSVSFEDLPIRCDFGFWDDADVLLAVAKKDSSLALKMAKKRVENYRKLALLVIKQNRNAFQFVSEEIRNEIYAMRLLRLGLVARQDDNAVARFAVNRLFDRNVLNIVQQFLIGDTVVNFRHSSK